ALGTGLEARDGLVGNKLQRLTGLLPWTNRTGIAAPHAQTYGIARCGRARRGNWTRTIASARLGMRCAGPNADHSAYCSDRQDEQEPRGSHWVSPMVPS